MPEGATRGWGGRMGDLLASMNGVPVFTVVSAAGNAVWLAGEIGAAVPGRQQRRDPHGHRRQRPDLRLGRCRRWRMQRIVTSSAWQHMSSSVDMAAVSRRSIDAEVALRSALKPASDSLFGTAPASGSYNAEQRPEAAVRQPA